LKFDSKEVLKLNVLVLSSVSHSEKVAAERRKMEGGQQMNNNCLLVAASTAALTAPYQFDLHNVFGISGTYNRSNFLCVLILRYSLSFFTVKFLGQK
jgi:hypothetical protein